MDFDSDCDHYSEQESELAMHADLDFEQGSEPEQCSEREFDSAHCFEHELRHVELGSDSQELGFASNFGKTAKY